MHEEPIDFGQISHKFIFWYMYLVFTYSGIPKDLAGPGLAHALHVALLILYVSQGVRDYLQARKSSKHLVKKSAK